eukprot:COSAG04_NODE_263_length_18621_cov_10.926790_10_plen_313_part_00
MIFDYNESIGSAHGDAFALRSGVLQTTVHVNRKSEYYRKLLPLNDTVGRRCGGPHDSGAPGCVYGSCCERTRAKRSTDAGRSWTLSPHNDLNRSVTEFNNYAFQFASGEVLQFTGRGDAKVTPLNGSTLGLMRMETIRSHDDARSQNFSTATLYAPAAFVTTCTTHSTIVALGDGSLLTNVYGSWSGADGLYKSRVAVFRSADRGHRWDYLSTVAWDPVNCTGFCGGDMERTATQNHPEGFTEATLARVDSKRVGYGSGSIILCFMRTWSDGQRTLTHHHHTTTLLRSLLWVQAHAGAARQALPRHIDQRRP